MAPPRRTAKVQSGVRRSARAAKAVPPHNDQDMPTVVASLVTALTDISKRLDVMDARFEAVDTTARSTTRNSTSGATTTGQSTPSQRAGADTDGAACTRPADDDAAASELATARSQARQRLQDLGLDRLDDTDMDEEYEYSHAEHSRKGMKSGKLRTAQCTVRHEVAWPHFYVYRADNTPATYDNLSMCEFVHGYLTLIAESAPKEQPVLQAHLRELMEDSTVYKWSVIRTYHSIILNMMETGRLTWRDTDKIQGLRRVHVWQSGQRATDMTRGRPRPAGSADGTPPNVTLCADYNQAKCSQKASHGDKTHACAFCWGATKRLYNHPADVCRRKLS